MIIVAGWARTGTSVMFSCLRKSGFYGGERKELTGVPYKTEHNQFRVCNFLIMYYSGFQSISCKEYKQQKVVDDFFVGLPESKKGLPLAIRRKMSMFLAYIEQRGINLLKDPQSAFAIKEWLKFDKMFVNAKYIWCRRDPLEAAKSFIRLKIPRIPQYRGVLTTKKALKTYKLHEAVWAKTLKDLNHHVVWLEDLLGDTERIGDGITNFIGRDFDTSEISEKETYKGGNRWNLKVEPFKPEELRPVEFA